MNTDILQKILDFMKSAGDIALRNYNHTDNNHFKSDSTIDIVTKSDIAISKLFRKFCADNFADLDYVIIDEESLDTLGTDPFAEVAKHEYQFVIDPIDGTLTYALGIPMFGISVGVLRRRAPLMGAIYAPALGELVYGDITGATWMRNVFSENQTTIQLYPHEIDRKALILNMDWFVTPNQNIDFRIEMPSNFYSAVVHFIYLATGRGRAHYFGVKIWDMSGGWALLKYLGFEFMNYNTGKILERLNSEDFSQKFKIKECHIVCKPNDFDRLKHIADLIEEEQTQI